MNQVENVSTATSEIPSDLQVKQYIYYGKPIQAAIGLFREYCNNTTIHGFRYFGERRRPALERLFWICVFIIAVIICGDFIGKLWDKWHNTPTIVAFDEHTIPVTEIPFPSVLVCPENKVHKKVFNFTQVLYNLKFGKTSFSNLTKLEKNYFKAHLHLCDPKISKRLNLSINNFPGEISEIIQLMAPPDKVSVPNYRFNSKVWVNDGLLERVVTADGLCFQFNGLVGNDLLRGFANETD